ncbi:MAG: universal stress protein [Hyphomonadaceae bacterium]|nr:universal stress protein [Hyphomonadaceae bacterium]GIK48605.1 MAG: universal stress protein [Alphaproteobacteria bacterium]
MSEPKTFACLVIADESEEFPDALIYAGLLCKNTGWRLVMLRVIEPSDPAPWASITEEMRRQAWDAAESLAQRFAAEVWAECGVTAEPILREGDLKPELRKLLEQDQSIKLVVLAAAHGPGGPGPLVAQLGKAAGLGARPVPVLVVPGALTREEIRKLALPVSAAPEPQEPG